MYDTHLLVDVGTLFFAVAGTYFAARRELYTRISKMETTLAEIKGALRQAGFKFN